MERAVVMTGLGGQGVQLVAKLLADAGIREGRQVMMFGVFMGMIRGGSSESTVVLADGEIESPPIVPSFWGVLAMHGEGMAKLGPKVLAGGVVLRNATMIPQATGWDGVREIAVPATAIAKEMGQPLGASMVALGALAAATGIVTVPSLVDALASVLPPHRKKHVASNRACLERGADWIAGLSAAAVPAWD